MKNRLAKVGHVSLAVVLAIALALLSVLVERTGPELEQYSNLCGPPIGNPLCYKPVLKGGFPVAYLFDAPGVSIERRLTFIEDTLQPAALAIDIATYLVAVLLAIRLVSRYRSASARATNRGKA